MNKSLHLILSLPFALLLGAGPAASDWPQWRGPSRDGQVPQEESVRLAETWPEGGPVLIWESEPIPGDDSNNGGYGSVVVADGRVYLYVNWQGQVTLPSRILVNDSLRRLGWSEDAALPAAAEEKVEAGRLSPERMTLEKKAVRPWIDEWMAGNLTGEEQEAFGSQVRDRLRLGAAALAPERIRELEALRKRFFATEEDLAASLQELGWSEESTTRLLESLTGEYDAKDAILCLDAADGKTLWRVEYPGISYSKAGTSSTPAIADGRCYVVGGNGFVYGLDARTGRTIWMTNPTGNVESELSSSPVVVDDRVVAMCVPLTAFDASTGEVIWQQPLLRSRNNSPVVWTVEGKNYLLCNDNQSAKVACVDPEDGRVVWTVPGGGRSTVVVSDGIMVVFSAEKQAHLSAVRLSLTDPEVIWRHDQFVGRGESPVVVDGHVYVFGMEGRAACVELHTGKIAWDAGIGRSGVASPIALDGKIVIPYSWSTKLMLIQATPDHYTVLAEAALPICQVASPAFAHGKLYLRMKHAVACYDIMAE
jgi:outer membrane protein assembly factor BamB